MSGHLGFSLARGVELRNGREKERERYLLVVGGVGRRVGRKMTIKKISTYFFTIFPLSSYYSYHLQISIEFSTAQLIFYHFPFLVQWDGWERRVGRKTIG